MREYFKQMREYFTDLDNKEAEMSDKSEKREEIATHMRCILDVLGFSNEPEMQDTPMRFAKYLLEFNQKFDHRELLSPLFAAQGVHSMIVQENIPFRGLCEHHLAPMTGKAYFGYIPNKSLVGLSKITRLVQAVGTERPSLQEMICEEITDSFNEILDPKGVITVIKAEHTCMTCRGVNAPGVITTTSSVRGVFRDVPQARQEFFDLIAQR